MTHPCHSFETQNIISVIFYCIPSLYQLNYSYLNNVFFSQNDYFSIDLNQQDQIKTKECHERLRYIENVS